MVLFYGVAGALARYRMGLAMGLIGE